MEMENNEYSRLMVKEMVTLRNNYTWNLVLFLNGWKYLGFKWVFKEKADSNGSVEKYKVRLVLKRYSQVEGIYFGDTFSLIAKLKYVKFLLSIVETFGLDIDERDAKIKMV